MSLKFTSLFVLFAICTTYSQVDKPKDGINKLENKPLVNKKKLTATFNNEKITVDGFLNEAIWGKTATASNFVSFEPDNGNPIPESKKTEVKIAYDNDAIYIGATMYDDEPNKILKEFALRDNFGTADFFGVFINGFNDGQQDFRFIVTAANTQNDCQASESSGEDYSWDGIWNSKVTITNFGWVAEIKIPYAALRFSPDAKQTWGINFMREVRRDRQKYTWSFVDAKLGTFIQQAGLLTGIENIKTPTRLFFLPYTSYYLNANSENKTKGTIKGGLDIKYGLNDAFTLDAVLIPDFGQTALDQKILNLGPFEQQFNENRPFFTEGTDLFSKGNLFYSRRIGGKPTGNATTNNNEEITVNPSTVGLLNALKVSGRTKNGLGIGVLNAVTENTYASIVNNTNGITRQELIEPLANYNILVFDQRFNKNSSVSYINTNVTRNGNFRDANVSALVYDLNTKANTFNLQGTSKISVVNDNQKYKSGWNANIEASKTSGKYQFGLGSDIMTKKYDNNDLGINFQTNYYSLYANASYRILNANKQFNRFSIRIENYNQFNLETSKPQESNINLNLNIGTKNNNAWGVNINASPVDTYDYYEARTEGRIFKDPTRIGFNSYYSSNYNKKFAYDFEGGLAWANQTGRNFIRFGVSPRYRFSDKLSLIYRLNFNRRRNAKGYATEIDTDNSNLTPDDIIIANRDVYTTENKITGKYSINSDMNFNLTLIHYWSFSENKNFLLLNQDGDLSDYLQPVKNLNRDFSTWNFDLSYSWWFTPGSQISVLYRNNAANSIRIINKDPLDNLANLMQNDILQHSFSISLKYFIDYNRVKNIF